MENYAVRQSRSNSLGAARVQLVVIEIGGSLDWSAISFSSSVGNYFVVAYHSMRLYWHCHVSCAIDPFR